MAKGYLGRRAFVVAGLLRGAFGGGAVAEELKGSALEQIRAIYADKASWTPAQRKLGTSLLYASRESRGLPMVQGLRPLRRIANRARVDRRGMALVDIRAEVTDALLQAIARAGGTVLSSHPAFRSVRARIPIRQAEEIAAVPEVQSIAPALGFLVNTGSVTSLGDLAHAAASARSAHTIDGTGVKIGVLSDGVDSLGDRQASNDLPPTCASPPGSGACVKVVAPQCDTLPCGGDEGTAMMEIIHDLAPGAQLYFAGTDITTSPSDFAQNILNLRNVYGCDIIVDDITYLDEGAFQDDVIARAVNTVAGAGALYFSSAGNSGRKDAGTSGTWEGDFLNSGTTLSVFDGSAWDGLPIHSWNGLTGGSAVNANELTAGTPNLITLKWSDPLGGAVTDYDLFDLDSGLTTIYEGSVDDQTVGGQDPFEYLSFGNIGEKIVVVRWSGPTKALHLDTNRGQLAISTAGAVYGHNGGQNTISVAAADVSTAGGGAFTGGAANPVEDYSSDGPRRIFYYPNGTAITPGKVTFASGGGVDLQKPDLTAADCVVTTTPGFNPFCGTSAAAPHAAAIAALLKSAPGNPSTGQALGVMLATALDVTPAGRDRNSGVGIAMADAAADAITSLPPPGDFNTVTPCRVVDTRLVGLQTTGSPLTCGRDWDVTVGGICGVPTTAKAVSLNLTVTTTSVQGALKAFASGSPPPLGGIVNYLKKDTRANNAIVSLDSAGKMTVQCSSGTTHVIVDVNGYFE